MKVNLTSRQEGPKQFEIGDKINENNPTHLRKVIEKLIQKSKSVIHALQATVQKLQKTEREKEYWKNNYLRFRELCQKYIDAQGIQHFKYLVQLQQSLKKLQVEKQCLLEQSRFRHKNSVSSADFNQLSNTLQKYAQEQPHKNSNMDTHHKQLARRESEIHGQKEHAQISVQRDRNKSRSKHRHNVIHKSINTISYNESHSEHRILPKKKLVKIQTIKEKQRPRQAIIK